MILPLVALASFAMAPDVPPRDRWFGADKLKHFFVSAFVQSVSYSAFRAANVSHDRAAIGASAFTLAVGIGKEVRDWRVAGQFSGRDLVWDAAGGAAAALLLERTHR